MKRCMVVNDASAGTAHRARINIRSVANVAAVRYEQRNGRDVMIVPSATLPDNIVMNDILYPAEEIGNSYKSLERTPAPYGHPMVGNTFVSARDPEGINLGYIGAWNENARRENGRVYIDKVIDIEFANRTENGKAVINAVKAGDPIHTSTGLLCDLDPADEGDGHKYIARNMEFDHDAILLEEEGAGTPADGVGMLVNGKKIEVVNSAIDAAVEELDWAADSVVRAFDRLDRASIVERLKTVMAEFFGAERDSLKNGKEEEMAVSEEQFNELSGKVNALSDSVDKIGETIGNAVAEAVKPLTDNLADLKANQEAKDKAELDSLVDKIVKANVLDEASAKELTLNAARGLAKKCEPGKAAALNGAFGGNTGGEDDWSGYDMNDHIEPKKTEA